MFSYRPGFLGRVHMHRMGQVDFTPVEAEAWLESVRPGLKTYPECKNQFVNRAEQIVTGLRAGSVQYDELIPITSQEIKLQTQVDECLSTKESTLQAAQKKTELVWIMAGTISVLGLAYWALS